MAGVKRRAWAALLTLALILGCVPGTLAAETAATVQLTKTEGTVGVSNRSGRNLSIREDMRIYNGYQLKTEEASYAWLNLDSSKFVKLDAVSELEVRKDGKKLELLLNEGNLFFNVTEPLEEDETLNIRVSTMTMGIRGTCGWVKTVDQWTSRLYVLEGAVQASVTDPVTGQDKTETIAAGESALCVVYPQGHEGIKCDILRDEFSETDIDGFVLAEVTPDSGLCEKIFDNSGLDLRGYSWAAADRLRRDQTAVREELTEIRTQVNRQDNHIASDLAWTSPNPGPAPTVTPSYSYDWSDSGDDYPTTPTTPTTPSVVTLTMPVDDDTVHHYLSQSSVSGVVLQMGSRASDIDLLEVDSGITIPAGKSLTLQSGVAMEILTDQTVRVDGSLTLNGGDLSVYYGKICIRGQVTVTGYFSGVIQPAADTAVIKATDLYPHPDIPGWKVSTNRDSAGYYTLEPVASNVTYEFDDATGTLTIKGSGPMEDYGGPTTTPWYDKAASITKVFIEPGVTTVGARAFHSCSNLNSVTIPNTVTTIGHQAFYYCGSLISVTIPASVTNIGIQAFGNCRSLTALTVDSGNANFSEIDGVLFNKDYTELLAYPTGKSDATYTIPTSVTSIGDDAFEDCTNLASVTIPEGVISIGDNAFYCCAKLNNVTFPSTLTSIGLYAFVNCDSLTSIMIPEGVISIGVNSFAGCDNLASVTIPSSVTSIGAEAFVECGKLNSLVVDSNNSNYLSADNVLFNKAKTKLITYPQGKTDTSYTIPDGVTNIDVNAFCWSSLQSVTIPASVKTIDYYAFANCTNLTAITYNGTKDQWNTLIASLTTEDIPTDKVKVTCLDGVISPSGRASRAAE